MKGYFDACAKDMKDSPGAAWNFSSAMRASRTAVSDKSTVLDFHAFEPL